MRELLYPLRRLWFALRCANAAFRCGWRIHHAIHEERRRVEQEALGLVPVRPLPQGLQALYEDVLEEAGSDVLQRTFGKSGGV